LLGETSLLQEPVTREEILAALREQNSDRLGELVMRNASFCDRYADRFDVRDFVPEELAMLLDLLDSPELMQMSDPSSILSRFQADWAGLDAIQRKRLLEHIAAAYGSYGDWYTWFLMTEILGEYVANDEAFRVTTDLMCIQNERARALLPHAFEHLASIEALRKAAIARLKEGIDDGSPPYRAECELSLARIARNEGKKAGME
jgi:hypothetical protein